jgi:plastocyanin
MSTRRRIATTGAALFLLSQLVLVAPVAASPSGPAAVTADMPSAVPAGHLWAFNDFFPRTVSVRTGTDLQFISQGFHTFTVLAEGTSAKQDEHANGIAQDDTDDAGLNPNGTTHATLNTGALMPTSFTCGTSGDPCDFDGGSVVSSGTPGGPSPFVVHVSAQPGTYVFICRVHAGMTGTLKVVGSDAKVPSADQVQKQVAKQVAKDLKGAWAADKQANHDAKATGPHGSTTWHVTAGVSSPDGHVALLEFFPKNLDVKPGDKVEFTPRSPNEPHTVTFPVDMGTEFNAFCEVGSVDVPFGPPDFNCNGGPPDEIELDGGNGVWQVTSPSTVSDSGMIGPRRLTSAVGAARTDVLNKWTVSFAGAAPGTYTYVCQVHDGMEATITVD